MTPASPPPPPPPPPTNCAVCHPTGGVVAQAMALWEGWGPLCPYHLALHHEERERAARAMTWPR